MRIFKQRGDTRFKEFAMRGNVLDMAVGIIVGAAFEKIVTSFVSDVLMPALGLLLGKKVNRMKRQPPAAPTSRDCRYRAAAIPIQASRGPHCTFRLRTAQTGGPASFSSLWIFELRRRTAAGLKNSKLQEADPPSAIS